MRYGTPELYATTQYAACMLMRYVEGLYGILGVTKTASQQEIRAAYKRLAHSLHPDKHLQDKVLTLRLDGVYNRYSFDCLYT